ncbi:uncharacterized protein [Fopius arisanus]|uniref:Uncharacterized protein isoform X1 n=2 Tax=Fopius arisanus TaxID=64838 RepID=A0A9R1TAA3_9HYME|nr:PREDICTED: uncharacterized protein LOC105268114 isoform X1 [Fopius arisanus]XP_011305717.1 PREDICTED: uncharacterized protein LOC105268114 isoform X1 [Fopius arisanus]XP_011305726.1 PREDICTED: uncharacterized protein LOC105268114 isoform X1 [Fopius arisanus]
MEVPRFPSPPSPLDTTSTPRGAHDITSKIRHVSPVKFSRTCNSGTSNINTQKKRAHRITRLGNTVHPRVIGRESTRYNRSRVTHLTVTMTERREDDEDDADVVCATGIPMSFDSRTLSGELSVQLEVEGNQKTLRVIKSTGVQTHLGEGPYRLKVFPALKDIVEEDPSGNPKTSSRLWRHLRFLGRLSLCQFGLAWLLTFWAVAGAASFYATEGPREREQVYELKDMQRDLAVGLATELRQLRAEEEEMEPLWGNKVKQYVAKHEKLLLAAISSGYGEGGEGGQLWTFPGCVLFSISLLTTLGFGAPVPRTTPGRTVAVVFAAIGIPAHFLLILNVGLFLAMKLQKFAIRRKYGNHETEASDNLKAPGWVKAVPFCCIGGYYILGIIGFGVSRLRPVAASLLFPLDFTAAGGLANTSGLVRIFYGLYLEGAVTIAAVAVAVLRVSASESLTNIGLKYGLLTEA